MLKNKYIQAMLLGVMFGMFIGVLNMSVNPILYLLILAAFGIASSWIANK